MTPDDQLDLWVKGKSVHNTTRGECCPDFSCCHTSVVTSQEEKDLFYKSWNNRRRDIVDGMLLMFLSKALQVSAPTEQHNVAGFINV